MFLISRRVFTSSLAATALLPCSSAIAASAARSRLRGMLLGSLIGDAAGGPVEFKDPTELRKWLPATREWSDDRKLDRAEAEQLAAGFRLLPYAGIRPDPAPYAHWSRDAAAGTVTDDSRHKFFLMAALREASQTGSFPISQRELAREYLRYQASDSVQSHPGYQELCEEWLREYNQAARWVLGERAAGRATPVERLWGGIATNAGQMVLLPLAGAYPGQPAEAYRAAYQIGYIDNGRGKDLNSAIVAGLAAAIGFDSDTSTENRWQQLRAAMAETDPYRYGRIPWVDRPIHQWLDFADRAADRAQQSPKRLFKILEDEGQPRYYWDAHFVLASVWSMLRLTHFNALAALQLSLDFGHDTDSAAQLVGAFAGAVLGEEIFAQEVREIVGSRLEADYGESVDEWTSLLERLQDRDRYPTLVSDWPA